MPATTTYSVVRSAQTLVLRHLRQSSLLPGTGASFSPFFASTPAQTCSSRSHFGHRWLSRTAVLGVGTSVAPPTPTMTVDKALVAPTSPSRTVLIVGASYGGHRAAQHLVTLLPPSWRVVVLERNTHFNHLYAFPRVSVVPGHEQKVFVPYSKIFEPQAPLGPVTSTNNRFVHGTLISLEHVQHHQSSSPTGRGVARYTPLDTQRSGQDQDVQNGDSTSPASIAFDFLIYALGSHLPPPINIWSLPAAHTQGLESSMTKLAVSAAGSKIAGMAWLQDAQLRIAQARSVVVIGGGALGVQFASDIAYVHGTPSSPAKRQSDAPSVPKRITLLSSSQRLLPRFQPWMHEQALTELTQLGVDVMTGARADLSTLHDSPDGQRRMLRTLDGRTVEADVVLFCTGQRPNTDLLRGLEVPGSSSNGNSDDHKHATLRSVLNSKANGAAFVTPHLQLSFADRAVWASLEHVFVIGDAADAFGALNAGHTAFEQADVAVRNVARLVARQEAAIDSNRWEGDGSTYSLETYIAEPHKIKVSVGLERAINENNGKHRIIEGGKEDLNATGMWTRRGLDTTDMFA